MIAAPSIAKTTACAHCGERCKSSGDHKLQFCCTSCQAVCSLLNCEGMSEYYCLNETPGVTIKPARAGKFDFLNEPEATAKLITKYFSFADPSIYSSALQGGGPLCKFFSCANKEL